MNISCSVCISMSEEKGTPQNPHPVMKELLHEVSEVDKHFSGKLHR